MDQKIDAESAQLMLEAEKAAVREALSKEAAAQEVLAHNLKDGDPGENAPDSPYIQALKRLWQRHNDDPHHWTDRFADGKSGSSVGLIENCRMYAANDPQGLPGHQLMRIVAFLADLLDEVW